MTHSLAGKRILVTQAQAFMGPPICEVLAEQGADVVANSQPLAEQEAAASVVAAAGHFDILVANLALAAPFLVTAMVVGLAISLFQAVTTIHEQTLAFVPKALAVVAVLLLLLPWVVRSLVEFTTAVIEKIPQMAQ